MPSIDDDTLREMFRAEAETHLATLNAGLLQLERAPGGSEFFPELMRAAHSIKGAAKIVGNFAVVKIAHEVENIFVALSDQKMQLTPPLVDALLAGVDLLESIAERGEADVSHEHVDQVIERLKEPGSDLPATAPAPGCLAEAYPDGGSHGFTVRMRLPAKLDAGFAQRSHEQLFQAARRGPGTIWLECDDVTSVDPAGVALLAQLSDALGPQEIEHGVTIHFENPTPRFRRFLIATGLMRDEPMESLQG